MLKMVFTGYDTNKDGSLSCYN